MHRLYNRALKVALWGASLAFFSSLAFGQAATGNSAPSAFDLIKRKSLPTPSSTSLALEGAVDPETYILGPGDHLEFDIWGAFESQYDLLVAPDGEIAIPGIGNLPVAGLSLAAADSALHRAAQSSYPRASVRLRLTGVRIMKATISGAVEKPGAYDLSAVDRLTALIDKANGLLLPRDDEQENLQFEQSLARKTPSEQRRAREEAKTARRLMPEASLRHITILSRDGAIRQVDLKKFFATGDHRHNPILRDGDAVQIPLISRETGVLNAFGAVKSPGEYEFLPGDHLRDLIDIAGGLGDDAVTDDIEIVRFDAGGKTNQKLQVKLASADDRGPPLNADDRVFIRKMPDFRRKFQVKVTGEVKFPGSYSIENDKTKLSELIEDCGGLTDRANYDNARVVRRALLDVEDPEFERLKTLAVSDMTDMEYEYFKIRSREDAPSVVVNFKKLLLDGDTSLDIALQDKDEIEVPTLSPTVKVTGQVNNPGLIRFAPGEDYLYYVQKAGGFSWNARKGKMRLIKAQSGTWMKPKKSTPIEIGDTIFVPEKQEVDWWELSKDFLLVASQVATVMIMIKSL